MCCPVAWQPFPGGTRVNYHGRTHWVFPSRDSLQAPHRAISLSPLSLPHLRLFSHGRGRHASVGVPPPLAFQGWGPHLPPNITVINMAAAGKRWIWWAFEPPALDFLTGEMPGRGLLQGGFGEVCICEGGWKCGPKPRSLVSHLFS